LAASNGYSDTIEKIRTCQNNGGTGVKIGGDRGGKSGKRTITENIYKGVIFLEMKPVRGRGEGDSAGSQVKNFF